MERTDLTGRVLGIIAFLGGIGVLAVVFVFAYTFFTSQSSVLPIPSDPNAPAAPTSQLGASAVDILAKILTLIVMTIVGSIIAGKGLQMYFNATGGGTRGSETKE